MSDSNTENEYDCEVREEKVISVVNKISQSDYFLDEGKSCYVVGMGGHPKSTYKDLGKEEGIKVIKYESVLPGFSKILAPIVASYAGLVKIENSDKLSTVFTKLINLSMASIYCFDSSIENEFVQLARESLLPEERGFNIKSDRGYFWYMVDADNAESSTGIYEIVSYGHDAPESLKM